MQLERSWHVDAWFLRSSYLIYGVLVGRNHSAPERINSRRASLISKNPILGRTQKFSVSRKQLFNTFLTKFVRFHDNYLSDGWSLLSILVCLHMLPHLAHNCAQLEVEFAQVAIGLELGRQLFVRLLHALVKIAISRTFTRIFFWGGATTHAIILIEFKIRMILGFSCIFLSTLRGWLLFKWR